MTTPEIPAPPPTDAEIEKTAALLVKAQQLVGSDSAHNPAVAAYVETIRELLAVIKMLLTPAEPEVDERLQKAFTESYDEARGRAR